MPGAVLYTAKGVERLRLRLADNFVRRLCGLILSAPLTADEGLLVTRCRSVHSCWMRYSIDLAWLDGDGRVLRCVPMLKPWRASVGPRAAMHVLELPAGYVRRYGLQVGDRVEHPLLRNEACA